MSKLGGVINITNFQGFSTRGRNPVDNPAALRASHYVGRGAGYK